MGTATTRDPPALSPLEGGASATSRSPTRRHGADPLSPTRPRGPPMCVLVGRLGRLALSIGCMSEGLRRRSVPDRPQSLPSHHASHRQPEPVVHQLQRGSGRRASTLPARDGHTPDDLHRCALGAATLRPTSSPRNSVVTLDGYRPNRPRPDKSQGCRDKSVGSAQPPD
jgi:hypothetical protein